MNYNRKWLMLLAVVALAVSFKVAKAQVYVGVGYGAPYYAPAPYYSAPYYAAPVPVSAYYAPAPYYGAYYGGYAAPAPVAYGGYYAPYPAVGAFGYGVAYPRNGMEIEYKYRNGLWHVDIDD